MTKKQSRRSFCDVDLDIRCMKCVSIKRIAVKFPFHHKYIDNRHGFLPFAGDKRSFGKCVRSISLSLYDSGIGALEWNGMESEAVSCEHRYEYGR